MNYQFEARKGLILVKVKITGKLRTEQTVFALDTGATKTVINLDLLKRIGYTVKDFRESLMITTGSGQEKSYLLNVRSIDGLGIIKRNFSILAFQLPVTTFVEGLLGLDFFRNRRLFINFRDGSIEVG
jgi:predicted aspartyl protease